MPKIDSDTKQKILDAAEQVFHTHGFKGTRTVMIAEAAGISRTMLHYHYSTKEALFTEVLERTMTYVLRQLAQTFRMENKKLEDLLCHLIDVTADLLASKPSLAVFLANMINESPEMAIMVATSGNDVLPKLLDNLLVQAREKGEVLAEITGEDLLLNIYALCSFPYMVWSYVKFKEDRTDQQMQDLIYKRRAMIKEMIIKSLK